MPFAPDFSPAVDLDYFNAFVETKEGIVDTRENADRYELANQARIIEGDVSTLMGLVGSLQSQTAVNLSNNTSAHLRWIRHILAKLEDVTISDNQARSIATNGLRLLHEEFLAIPTYYV